MEKEKLFIKDFLITLYKHKIMFILIMIVCGAFSFQLTRMLSKKYKSHFIIFVHSKYFNNPLVNSIVPGIRSVPEMRNTIDSMIKGTLNDEYKDDVAKKYNLIDANLIGKKLKGAMQSHRDKFDFHTLGGQTYQVGYISKDPDLAKKVVEEALAKVIKTFLDERINNIKFAREVLEKRLESLAVTSESDRGKSSQALQGELKVLKRQAEEFEGQFSRYHPKVQDVYRRIKAIQSWIRNRGIDASVPADGLYTQSDVYNLQAREFIQQSLHSDYHNLTLAMEIEKRKFLDYITVLEKPEIPLDPFWPRNKIFYSLGIILGFILSLAYMFVFELVSGSRDDKLNKLAENLKTIVLGNVPELPLK